MSTIKDIIISQRNKLNESLKYYDELISNFDKCSDVYNEDLLDTIEKTHCHIDEINSNFEKIQYNFDLTIINKDLIEKKRIENYEIQQKIFKLFTPYMIYLRLLLKNE